LPREHRQLPTRVNCSGDVGEGSDRVAEEHRGEAAERPVERRLVEWVDVGVALLERDVCDAGGSGLGSRSVDHPGGEVDAGHGARRCQSGRLASEPAGPASDVEDPALGRDVRGGEQSGSVAARCGVVAFGELDPVVPLGAVPRRRHFDVRDHDRAAFAVSAGSRCSPWGSIRARRWCRRLRPR